MLSLCHMSPLLGDFMALLFPQLALKISYFLPPGNLLSIEKGPLSVVLGGPEQQSLLLLPGVVNMVSYPAVILNCIDFKSSKNCL